MVVFLRLVVVLVQLSGLISCTGFLKVTQNELEEKKMDIVLQNSTGSKRSLDEAELPSVRDDPPKRTKATSEEQFLRFFHRKVKDYNNLEIICDQLKGVQFLVSLNPKIRLPPLHYAVIADDMKALEVMIKHLEPDFNALDRNGHTALTLSITFRRFKAFSLLAKHCDLRRPLALGGMNAFHVAAMIPSSIEYMKEILSHGVCTTLTCDRNGWNPFVYAALRDFDGNFQFLLQQAQPVEIEDSTNDYVIFLLMQKGEFKKVESVIKAGFPYDIVGPNNENILHLAAKSNALEIVDVVLSTATPKEIQKFTSARTRGIFEETPAEVAAHQGNLEVLKKLCPVTQFPGNVAILAVDYGHLDMVKYLFEVLKFDFYNLSDAPLLILAYYGGHTELLKYLISVLPLEVFYDTNDDCDNILQMAASEEDLDLVVLLLSKGMTPAEFEFGASASALAWAILRGNLEIVKLLLNAGARVDEVIDSSHFETEEEEIEVSNILDLAQHRLPQAIPLIIEQHLSQKHLKE